MGIREHYHVRAGAALRVRSRNDVYQRLDALKRNRVKRRQQRELFVEGVVCINAALANGWPAHAVVHACGARLSRWADDVLGRCAGALRVEMEPRLFSELGDREDGSELLLVLGMRVFALGDLEVSPGLMILIADRPSSPGNLGSVLRSADAFGAGGIVVLGHAADVFDPRAIRASRGAVFALPTVLGPSIPALTAWIGRCRAALQDLQIAGADPSAALPITEVDFKRPTLLVVGNEKWGLSAGLRRLVDAAFSIPTSGSVDSLNLAAAASIALYEARRQRGNGHLAAGGTIRGPDLRRSSSPGL